MDYVLFGMGYGATLMLLGWALRTFGPERKYKRIDPEDTDQVVQQRNWVRFIQGLGGVIAIAGSALVALTFVVMLINPSDDTGGLTAVIVWGFLVVCVLVWCWFYVGRFGTGGLWSKDQGYGFGSRSARRTPATSLRSGRGAVTPTVTPVSDPAPPIEATESTPPADFETEFSEVGIGPLQEQDQSGSTPSEPESTAEAEAQDIPAPEPEYDFGDSTDTTVPSEAGGRAEAIRRLRERQARTSRKQD